jgi:predicted metal-dependent hydrolase
MVDEQRELVVEGVTLELKVTRKRVKNINARLRGSTLSVSAPHRVPAGELEETIRRLARRLVRRCRADAVNEGRPAVEIARRVAARFPDPPKVADVVFVTNQTARWGSYSLRTGIVRLNAALRLMPPWVLEAVVVHELAHAFHPDHSPAFWELARRVCPKTDRARAFLEGVSWLASSWEDVPPVERTQLAGSSVPVEPMNVGVSGDCR